MKTKLPLFSIICFFAIQINSKTYSQPFTSSNLPIVVLGTGGQQIDSANIVSVVWMGIIDNGPGVRNNISDPFTNYNGEVELKIQGSSSLMWPKKSYRITTVDASHNNMDVQLFGFPLEHDWVFKALYQDKTFLRDELSFKLFNEMGHYSSRTNFFELVIDGDYRGVYQVEEKVKRGIGRIDISKLKSTDISGDDLTGGYIISLDKFTPGIDVGWYSNYNSNVTNDSANYFLYVYPKPDSIPLVQKNYIKNYVNKFENVLNSNYFNNIDSGYSKYINVPSFIDNFIINEISKNVDGYRCSSYFYKDKDSKGDGKLHAVPLWDYNIAWNNCYYNGGNNPSGWQYKQYATVNFVPFWWRQLMSDHNFKNQLKCRYEDLRTNVLSYSSLYSHIDSMAIYLSESQARNFAKWPIMGMYVWPNPTPIPTSFTGEVTNLKNWIQNRLAWLDANIPGVCSVGVSENESALHLLKMYPNPFMDNFNFEYIVPDHKNIREKKDNVKIELVNLLGDQVLLHFNGEKTPGTYEEKIDTRKLAAGTYILTYSLNDHSYHKKIVKLSAN